MVTVKANSEVCLKYLCNMLYLSFSFNDRDCAHPHPFRILHKQLRLNTFPVVGAMLDAAQPLSLTLFASDRCASWIRYEQSSPIAEAELSSMGESTPSRKTFESIGKTEGKPSCRKILDNKLFSV